MVHVFYAIESFQCCYSLMDSWGGCVGGCEVVVVVVVMCHTSITGSAGCDGGCVIVSHSFSEACNFTIAFCNPSGNGPDIWIMTYFILYSPINQSRYSQGIKSNAYIGAGTTNLHVVSYTLIHLSTAHCMGFVRFNHNQGNFRAWNSK